MHMTSLSIFHSVDSNKIVCYSESINLLEYLSGKSWIEE